MRARFFAAAAALVLAATTRADNTYQTLPFSHDWSNNALITTNNDWSGVPGILGCLGDDNAGSPTAVDPQTLTAGLACNVNVIANQSNPNTLATGGVAEFDGIANRVVALNGSGTADNPYLLMHINTLGKSNIRISYNLRDIDGSTDNSIQPVALQYRVGSSGSWTNVPGGFVADASSGPSLATLLTPVSVVLPAAVNNQAEVQIRILTTNAVGNDEWIGIDDIQIAENTNPSGSGAATPSSVEQGFTTLLTVTVTPGVSPVSTGLAVTADLTSIGGSSPQAFFDNGTNGDVASGDNVFSFLAAVPLATPLGAKVIPAAISDAQSRLGTANIGLTVTPQVQSLTIWQIQGQGTASPYNGQPARTTGIVTARISNGFFMQDPNPDTNPMTSEGIFVFTSSAPPAAAAIGALVQVAGTVSEFRRSTVPNGPPVTELTGPTVLLLTTGNALPLAQTITASDLTPGGGIAQLERFEGMRVTFSSITAVGPTDGTLSEANATSTTNGFFYAVISGTPRPFREPGVQIGDPDPMLPSPFIPRFDGNPEVFGVDSGAQTGTSPVDVSTGAVMTNITGVLHQDFGVYRVIPDQTLTPVGNISAVPVPAAQPAELKIGSFNLERFYDTVNDPGTSDVALTAAAFERRLKKASLAIRNVLGMPHVLAVVEMENLATLQALAARIDADAASASQAPPNYQACLVEGNDIGGIDVGFLYSSRVTLVDCVQFGKDTTYIDPNTMLPATLNDRPPIVLRGSIKAPGSDSAYPFTVVANHLRSLNDIDSPTDGNRVRAKRRAQAEFTASLLQDRQSENTISVGDYNAFQFSDGYVDVMGTIKGAPAPFNQVFLSSSDLVNPNYTNLVETVPPATGYSYVFSGNAQSLDHVLVNNRVLPRVTRYTVARLDADFPEAYRSDDNRPERISDHDAPVMYLRLPVDVTSSTSMSQSPVNYNQGQGQYMSNLSVKNDSPAPLPNPFYVVIEGLGPGVTLLNASGMTPEGLPYITVDRQLAPHATEVVQLRFGAPPNSVIVLTGKVYRSL